QRNLLSATAHVNLEQKEVGTGISEWHDLIPKLLRIPHVVGAAPVLYGQVLLSGPVQSHFAVLKGIDPQYEMKVSDILQHLKAGNIAGLNRSRSEERRRERV